MRLTRLRSVSSSLVYKKLAGSRSTYHSLMATRLVAMRKTKKPSVTLKDGELSAVKMNPAHLLTEMALHPSTAFSKQEADEFLGSHSSFFQDTRLIVDAPSRKWANCLNCGKTHEVTPVNGLLVL